MADTKISDSVIYIGADDHDIDLFESQYVVPNGVSYNSYVIIDEKIAVMDTADPRVTDVWFDNLEKALGGRKPDYLVVQHMEPDHAGNIKKLAEKYPEMKIVGNAKTFPMMKQFFEFDVDQYVVPVKEGDTLSLGVHTLTFVMAPMVHWPEVMVTYETTEKILFSADAFGSFGAIDGNIFADETDYKNQWLPEARRYYCNIVGKYGPQVQALLKKASGLEISMICPLHSLVWRKDLDWLLEKYSRWSSYEPEEKTVLIAYASVYGHTEQAADAIAARLAERGVPNIAVYDVSKTHPSYILADAFRCSALVFASITYNNGIFCNMETLLHQIAAHNLQNRTVAFLENGSWAPVSVKHMTDTFASLKNMKVLEESLTIRSSLKNCQGDCLEALVDSIFQSLA